MVEFDSGDNTGSEKYQGLLPGLPVARTDFRNQSAAKVLSTFHICGYVHQNDNLVVATIHYRMPGCWHIDQASGLSIAEPAR